MPMEYDFLTLAQAALRVKVPPTDPELPGLLTAASQALADWLGYPAHLREEVEETVPSEGGRTLFLRAGQVRRVVRVEVDGQEVPAEGYHLESSRYGRLVRRAGRWPFTGEWTAGVSPQPLTALDTGGVRVTFDSGWRTPGQVELARAANPSSTVVSELPVVLEEACLITLTALRAGAGRDSGVTSRSLGGGSVTWAEDRTAVPAHAQQLAAPYYKARRRGA